MDIYVCGHGDWGTIGRSGIFVTVPSGTEVIFYKEIGDVMLVSEAEAILSGAPNAPLPERVIRGGMQAPDMSLHPAREFWQEFGAAASRSGASWHAVATETHLSQIFERYQGGSLTIHWIACSVRDLAAV